MTRRLRRRIGLAGAAWAAAVATAFLITVRASPTFEWSLYDSIGLSAGCVMRIHVDAVERGGPIPRYPALRADRAVPPIFRPIYFAKDFFFLPLWIPFLPGAAASLLLIRARHAPGTCRRCGYDLRGTAGSVCPECGR
jgi:hypothetical protein